MLEINSSCNLNSFTLCLCFPPRQLKGLAILENEKIERHIMKNVPGKYTQKNLHDFISTPTNLSNVCNRRSQFVRARQRSRDTHRKSVLEAETRAGEEGRAEEQLTVGALAQDQRSSLPS